MLKRLPDWLRKILADLPKSWRKNVNRFYWWEHDFELRVRDHRFFKFLKRRAKLIVFVNLGFLFASNCVRGYKIDNLQLEVKTEINKRAAMDVQINSLNERIDNKYSFIDDVEAAYWEKWKSENDFVMIDLNEYAERLFQTSNREYRGRTDFMIQPFETATIYHKRDSSVIAQWRSIKSFEPFIYPDSTRIMLYVKTWPAIRSRDTLVRSFAIPIDTLNAVIKDFEK